MPRSRSARRLAPTLVAVVILLTVWWFNDAPPEAVPDGAGGPDPVAAEVASPPPPVLDRPSSSEPSSADTPTSDGENASTWAGLTEVRPNVFVSPAGLEYRQGSAEGHRLTHLMQHAEDSPDRPIHGVFDGSREEILALLDEVWQTAQTRGPPAVDREKQGSRTVYTVKLGRKIGYVGGKSGRRRGRPACEAVKLVVEGEAVITAYPVE